MFVYMPAKPSFTLFISKSSYDSRNAESALMFCYAALESGYTIKHVFFYQSGVHNGSDYLCVNADEVSVKDRWTQLHRVYKVPLYLCVTAATRRGVLHELDNHNPRDNLSEAFEAVGMSEYFAALHDKNVKSIQF
jgi:tRNA 2-thiouridine synthesizing protein D